jgi:hypothetical protein
MTTKLTTTLALLTLAAPLQAAVVIKNQSSKEAYVAVRKQASSARHETNGWTKVAPYSSVTVSNTACYLRIEQNGNGVFPSGNKRESYYVHPQKGFSISTYKEGYKIRLDGWTHSYRRGDRDIHKTGVKAVEFFQVSSNYNFTIQGFGQNGQMGLSAQSFDGVSFRNGADHPMSINFMASGTWTYTLGKQPYCNAMGSRNKAHHAFRMPGWPAGGLIVRRGNGRYEWMGTHRTLKLAPFEVVRFMMNDTRKRHDYADNCGTLTIKWAEVR